MASITTKETSERYIMGEDGTELELVDGKFYADGVHIEEIRVLGVTPIGDEDPEDFVAVSKEPYKVFNRRVVADDGKRIHYVRIRKGSDLKINKGEQQ